MCTVTESCMPVTVEVDGDAHRWTGWRRGCFVPQARAVHPATSPSRLHDIVDRWATDRPDDLALVYGDERWTWRRLADGVDRLAGALAAVAEPGDRVAFVSDNVPAWVVAYYGVPRAGMVLAFV